MPGSLREVKSRIASTKKTAQITSAMHMVSSAKVKRAEKTYKGYKNYMSSIGDLVATVLGSSIDTVNPLLVPREVKKTAYLLISSDTGLAGPYNSNVFRRFTEITENESEFVVGTIGRKAYGFAKSKGYEMLNDESVLVRDDVMFIDVVPLAKKFIDLYLEGKIDKLVIIYNHYVNSMTIEVLEKVLLPIENIKGEKINQEYLYEGGIEETLSAILPMYVEDTIYGIILDAKTAEHSSRMNAMKSATDNATEVIDKLQIMYNRARQSAITTELIDIVSGAAAVE